jgi:glycine oxidase
VTGDAGDLIVVGAGPWGLACAWTCAAAGARVRVIDDDTPPAGWVAAGMLGPWSEAEEGRDALNALLARSDGAWPDFARTLRGASGVDPGHLTSGTVLVAHRPEHVGAVRHRLARTKGTGRVPAWCPGARLREIEPGLSPRVAGGADLPGEHQVDPRRLLTALRAAAWAAGVAFVAGTAGALRRDGLELVSGEVLRAQRVLVAAGAGAARLSARVPVRPIKGQILRLAAPAGALLPIARVVRTPAVYLVPRRDGELVVGATSEEAGDRRVEAGAVQRLLEEAIHAVPGVRDLEWREAAAGLRPATADGLPALGEDADGVLWATGGHRHGILMTPIAAEAVAACVVGDGLPDWAAPLSPARFEEPACASR